MFALKSSALTWPEPPTFLASKNARSPLPQQTSSAVSPTPHSVSFTTRLFHVLWRPRLSASFSTSYTGEMFVKSFCLPLDRPSPLPCRASSVRVVVALAALSFSPGPENDEVEVVEEEEEPASRESRGGTARVLLEGRTKHGGGELPAPTPRDALPSIAVLCSRSPSLQGIQILKTILRIFREFSRFRLKRNENCGR